MCKRSPLPNYIRLGGSTFRPLVYVLDSRQSDLKHYQHVSYQPYDASHNSRFFKLATFYAKSHISKASMLNSSSFLKVQAIQRNGKDGKYNTNIKYNNINQFNLRNIRYFFVSPDPT